MLYIRNIAFTKLFKAAGRLREFNFRRRLLGEEPIYEIDVSDERGNRHYLSAFKNNEGKWVLGNISLPSWIAEAAANFNAAILEHEPLQGTHAFA